MSTDRRPISVSTLCTVVPLVNGGCSQILRWCRRISPWRSSKTAELKKFVPAISSSPKHKDILCSRASALMRSVVGPGIGSANLWTSASS